MRMLPLRIEVLLAISAAALGTGTAGCGGASPSTTVAPRTHSVHASTTSTKPSVSPPVAHHQKDSNDGDRDPNSNDDNEILKYGHAANRRDEKEITSLVEHFYAAAAADNGSKACALIFSIQAELIPEEYGKTPGPPSLRGKTCAVVLQKFYRQLHRQMAADVTTLKVTGVRIEGKKGYALLRLRGLSEPRALPLHIEFGVWKIFAMLDNGMP
jgi:hypothetical protein